MSDNLLNLEIESLQRELQTCLRDLTILSGVEVTLAPKGGLRYNDICSNKLLVTKFATMEVATHTKENHE